MSQAYSSDGGAAFDAGDAAFSPRTKMAAHVAKRDALDPKLNPLVGYVSNLKASSVYKSEAQ